MAINTELKRMTMGATAMVFLSVVCLIGIAVMTQIGDLQKENTGVTGEQITLLNGTAVSLAHDELVTTIAPVLYNATDSTDIVGTGNYTVQYGDGTITLATTATWTQYWNNTLVNASYTYRADTSTTTTAALFTAGLTIFATFSGLVALILIGVIVLRAIKPDKE